MSMTMEMAYLRLAEVDRRLKRAIEAGKAHRQQLEDLRDLLQEALPRVELEVEEAEEVS